jgi:hypothetical protein
MSDDNKKPLAVSITPVSEDFQVLRAGSPKPSKLPNAWKRKPKPQAEQKSADGARPSTAAGLDAESASSAKVDPDAGALTDAALGDADFSDAGPSGASSILGDPNGKDGGKIPEKRELAAAIYRDQLAGWFRMRFNIRGKVPFDTLKTLHATAVIDISPDRKVTGYDVKKGSGNEVFDDRLYRDLASVQVSGAVLPAPPDDFPDIQPTKLTVTFQCTSQASCE